MKILSDGKPKNVFFYGEHFTLTLTAAGELPDGVTAWRVACDCDRDAATGPLWSGTATRTGDTLTVTADTRTARFAALASPRMATVEVWADGALVLGSGSDGVPDQTNEPLLLSGATLVVDSGGIAYGPRAEPGASIVVGSSGFMYDAVVAGSMTYQAGYGSAVTVVSGGVLSTSGGGSSYIDGVAVESGGRAEIGNFAGSLVVSGGGSAEILAGGTASIPHIKPGGTLLVHSGGVASWCVVSSGSKNPARL